MSAAFGAAKSASRLLEIIPSGYAWLIFYMFPWIAVVRLCACCFSLVFARFREIADFWQMAKRKCRSLYATDPDAPKPALAKKRRYRRRPRDCLDHLTGIPSMILERIAEVKTCCI